ncbi:hypothetical protein ACV3P0_14315 [Clostridium perfringens]|nr:DUF4435 domain-containing protein [Clostridium perfringens]ELC8433779.1 DUF4435 domain-containing protein [Clostridium perfringens]
MGSNSVRGNITVDDVISEINLIMKADKKRKIVVVEGQDDLKLFNRFIENGVILRESFNSKQGVLKIKERYKNNNNVIGIVDKDYDESYLNQKGLFYYDYSSMEIMMINALDVFESVCNECCLFKEDIESFRDEILNRLLNISLLRKYNYINNIGININKIAISELLLEDNTVCDIKLLDTVEVRNSKNENWINNKEDIREYINTNKNKSYTVNELMYLTRGHDFVYMLLVYCSSIKGKKYSADILQGFLRCAFTVQHFKETRLWTSLNKYCIEEGLKFFRT